MLDGSVVALSIGAQAVTSLPDNVLHSKRTGEQRFLRHIGEKPHPIGTVKAMKVFARHFDSAFVRKKTGDGFQQRRLAGAIRTEQRGDRAVPSLKRDIPQHGARAERHLHAFCQNGGVTHRRPPVASERAAKETKAPL